MSKQGPTSENALARLSGVPQPTIHRILAGHSRDPETATLEKLARYYKISLAEIRGEVTANAAAQTASRYNIEHALDIRPVKLISWVQAGRGQSAGDPYKTGDGEKTIYTSKKVGPRAYALRVRGDSMENPAGKPTFPEGCIIVVDPDKTPIPGSFVVVRMDNSEEATFKQLVEDAGRRYRKPLNPRYPIERIDDHATLCGTWVQTIIDSD